mmetsp:Transcript_13364/g.24192  ORF Transcript_13364/g.24192 Transcript_13364/m.24192 type:complete len:93 (+) Transcript_13364:345-623(+)
MSLEEVEKRCDGGLIKTDEYKDSACYFMRKQDGIMFIFHREHLTLHAIAVSDQYDALSASRDAAFEAEEQEEKRAQRRKYNELREKETGFPF